jgi:hypothetical protein
VFFTLTVPSTFITDDALNGYRAVLSILTNINVNSISIRAVSTPPQRRLLVATSPSAVVQLQVTILVADWAGAAYVIAIVSTDSFQSNLAALCQQQSLPVASVVAQSVGYANVAPPTTAPPPPPPPPPPPSPIIDTPFFSSSDRAARPPLIVVLIILLMHIIINVLP